MIEVNNLSKRYGDVTAANIPSLNISSGEIVGLVGNNGAGKTTLFNLLMDLIKADEGEVIMHGFNVANSEEWKPHTGAFISENFIIDFLTPEEYFQFIAGLYKWDMNKLKEFLSNFEDLFNGEVLNNKKYIRDLSKGNQKKVGIAGAFIGSNKLTILDEPFANLDPTSQNRLKQLISGLHNEENAILVSSHDLNHVADISTRILIMENGAIEEDMSNSEAAFTRLRTYFKV